MKKIILTLLTIITITLVMTGCSNNLKTYNEISLKEFKDKMVNRDDFILYIGAKDCPACERYTVKLNKIIEEHQITIYYIDINLFNEDETKEFGTYLQFSGTPTTVFIKNGEEETTHNRIDGNQSNSKIIETLKINGYIKE